MNAREQSRESALQNIADEVQSWLDYQETEYARERIKVDGSTHVMCVPFWPTREQLQNWVKALRGQ